MIRVSISNKVLKYIALYFLISCIGHSTQESQHPYDLEGHDQAPNQKLKILNRKLEGETEATIPIRDHSLYAPYVDSNLQSRFFDFGGSTIIETSKYVRLTQDRPSQAGYLWSRTPITHPNFEVEVEFKIDGKSHNVYGDGMAIWLTKNPNQLGPVFGSVDMWDGFGVFIDTFPNSRHSYEFPRIIGMANHGYKTYDVGNDGDGQESGACSINVRSPEISTKLKIHYIRGQFLEVLIHHENWNEWDHCFTVFNYTLPESPYLGFSAHTGEVFDNHDIIYASANGLVYHPPKSTHKDSKNKKKNSWFSFSSGSKEKSHNYDYEYDEDSLGAGGIGSGIRLGFWGKLVAYLVWLIKFGFVLGLIGVGLFWGNKLSDILLSSI